MFSAGQYKLNTVKFSARHFSVKRNKPLNTYFTNLGKLLNVLKVFLYLEEEENSKNHPVIRFIAVLFQNFSFRLITVHFSGCDYPKDDLPSYKDKGELLISTHSGQVLNIRLYPLGSKIQPFVTPPPPPVPVVGQSIRPLGQKDIFSDIKSSIQHR